MGRVQSFMLILGRVGLGHFTCGSGWVGSRNLDPRPTLWALAGILATGWGQSLVFPFYPYLFFASTTLPFPSSPSSPLILFPLPSYLPSLLPSSRCPSLPAANASP